MERQTVCTRCGKTITVSGHNTGAKEVKQKVTCPGCGEPNEVKWPMDAGWDSVK